jgi:flagellar motor switch/type III secretory pathway protein FliN
MKSQSSQLFARRQKIIGAAREALFAYHSATHCIFLCCDDTLTAPLAAMVSRLLNPLSKTDSRDLRNLTGSFGVEHACNSDNREDRPMNTATKTAMPMIEAKVAKSPSLPERPDPAEFLPWLPCTLALDLPVINFTVGDLLSLAKGSIVETGYHQSSDLPLRVNGQLVGWTEFEVVGERLAVRLTDLS